MSTLKNAMIRKHLSKKGFVCENGSKHWFLAYEYNGKRTGIHSAMSKGQDEISDQLINKMARDIKLNTRQFIDLSICNMSKKEYETIVKKLGHI